MNIHPSALQILGIVEQGKYTSESGRDVDIRALQTEAGRRTEVWTPEALAALLEKGPASASGTSRVEVIDATTQAAARDLSAVPGGVVLLNFASAKNPGGGFLGGAKAQEEDICRCSGLYSLLAPQSLYYDTNRATKSLLYTDHMIYSRDVPFFRVRGDGPFLEAPFVASVITAPAPNAGAFLQREPDALPKVRETFERRWPYVLALAEAMGHKTVLLGAWGCGAFRCDPETAAGTVAAWLKHPRFASSFDRVVFAIPSFGRSAANLAVFQRHFAADR